MKIAVQFVKHIPSLGLTMYTPEHNYLSINNARNDNPRLLVSGLTHMQKPQIMQLMKDLMHQSHFPDITSKSVVPINMQDINVLQPWKSNAVFYTSSGQLFNCRFRLDDNSVIDLWLDQEKMKLPKMKNDNQRNFWIMHIYTRHLRDYGLTNEFVRAQLWTWTEDKS